MNKEDLYPLIGKYLNGYKITKIEEDPFVKGQINLWTDEWRTEYFGDKALVKFYVRPESGSAQIYKELVDKELYHNLRDKKAIDKMTKIINDYKKYCGTNKGFTEYTDIQIEAIERVINDLDSILKECQDE